jgi:DNA-binding NarL/FixJ family response regulator
MTGACVLSTDLMDRSKFPAGTRFVRRADDLTSEAMADADVIAVDLARPDAVDGVRRLRAAGSTARIVAYGSHVDRERLAEARDAGCDEVLPRSEFFGDVAAVLAP